VSVNRAITMTETRVQVNEKLCKVIYQKHRQSSQIANLLI